MLDLPVPAHANCLHSKYLQGNCTDFFIYVATQITGPIAVRRSAWGTLESTNYLFEKQLVPENNSAPMTPAARLSLQLWDRGWHVAMVQCPEQEKPTLINDPMFAPFMVTPPDDRATWWMLLRSLVTACSRGRHTLVQYRHHVLTVVGIVVVAIVIYDSVFFDCYL